MIQYITAQDYIYKYSKLPVFDVRSPLEYKHARIPGAFSLPIFTDEERKEIGTLYKQKSRAEAIKSGLKYFGPRLNEYHEKVSQLLVTSEEKKIIVQCWRGGMRSAAMAWLLDLCGYEVFLIKGGYKSYRRYVLNALQAPFAFRVLSGMTGSGKTEILNEFKKLGHAVVDLEGIANHKGSAFGALGMPEQPSQEYFENLLVHELQPYFTFENNQLIQHQLVWLESESQRIGQINIPNELFNCLRQSENIKIVIPFEERLKFIVEHYGKFETEKLVNAIIRIKKRLGGLGTKEAIQALIEGDIEKSFSILLKYYDRFYSISTEQNRTPGKVIELEKVNALENTAIILEQIKKSHE